ncbi:MAG: MerR family transcriptional regulator [Lachnospiraceae bacterium]|nr:MerR family transcriptional regulator [Lachnospiraceae bacterium]
MGPKGYYSSGKFAKMAHVTKKTLRYYDEHGYLKPSYVSEAGARYYLDEDFQRIQQIQLLKYLGFSLDEIMEMSLGENRSLAEQLSIQTGLVEQRIEQLKLVRKVLQDTREQVIDEEQVNWAGLMDSISEIGLENSLKTQYLTASNISTRINLHKLYSENKQGWFRWIYEQVSRQLLQGEAGESEKSAAGESAGSVKSAADESAGSVKSAVSESAGSVKPAVSEAGGSEKSAASEAAGSVKSAVSEAAGGVAGAGLLRKETGTIKVLELGCGDGSLWKDNYEQLPENILVLLTDKSEGMLREVRKQFGQDDRFSYRVLDINRVEEFDIINPDGSDDGKFDLIIANHVLFYAEDFNASVKAIKGLLRTDGIVVAATYGKAHMTEISELAAEFDPKIRLAAEELWEAFGKENGGALLKKHFDSVDWRQYKDGLYVTRAEDLIDYILSCHGNQNSYLVDKYKEFRQFVRQKVGKGFYVTKDAGFFIAR